MKILMLITIILFGVFILFQLFIIMATNKTETQAYKVIRKENDFEIRHYPSATMAMIESNATSYRDLGNPGFSKLAKFIFGGNSERKNIAMTTPVHMDIGETKSTMAFVLPSSYNLTNVPKPNDDGISITTSEPEYVAAIQFGGFASNESINQHKLMLENALKQIGITFYGNFRFLGYNPPYQFFNRRNEVIVSINENEINKN